jgi:transcriptional regulator with XRE-family HTH domain
MFWDVVRGRIAQRRLTQDEVANALHISRSSLSRRLGGQIKDRPNELMIDRLARLLRLNEAERQQLRTLAGSGEITPDPFEASPTDPGDLSRSGRQDVDEPGPRPAAGAESDPLPPFRPVAEPRPRPTSGRAPAPHVRPPRWPGGWFGFIGMAAVLVAAVAAVLTGVVGGKPVRPGGLWLGPANGESLPAPIHLAARAYPTSRADPAIAYVVFTVSWDGRPGPWMVACRPDRPVGADVYACDWDPAREAEPAPPGQLHLSFDVYDVQGNVNRAPHGPRTITYLPAR